MFGMGTGGSLRLLSPEILFGLDLPSTSALQGLSPSLLRLFSVNRFRFSAFRPSSLPFQAFPHLQNRTGLTLSQFLFQWLAFLDQALDLLVSASSICYHTSTADLSTSSSLRGLTYLRSGSLILQGGFTLRCLQRLSLPHFASLLCPWQNNSFTRGASIPVLSY